jgi:hypothetical protein
VNSIVPKKVRLTLVGLDGNIAVLIGAFIRQARREDWEPAEVDAVVEACMAATNYHKAVATLMAHCEGGGLGISNDEEDDQ